MRLRQTIRTALVAAVFVAQCSTSARPRSFPHPTVHPVARVDGEVITAEEVAALAQAENIPPRAALDRIVNEHLLAREGRRRAWVTDTDAELAQWRALIQRYLQVEIEEPWSPSRVPPGLYQAEYERRRVQFSHDGLVRVVHALALSLADAGVGARQESAQKALAFRARVMAATGGRPTAEQFEQLARNAPGGALHFESIDPFDRTGTAASGGRFHEEFARAAWGLSDASPVSDVVETPFGYHVILRVGEVAPLHRPEIEARQTIVRDVVEARRRKALSDMLDALRARYDVEVSDVASDAIERRSDAP